MIRVTTGSRLHFGLLALPGSRGGCWPNTLGEAVVPAREFGGVGLMVHEPRLALTAHAAADWSAEGPLAERALEFARRYAQAAAGAVPPQRFVLEAAPPEHRGLGAGTQLALAVAAALACAQGRPAPDAIALAARLGRGARSGIGIHGFGAGGLLVDGGKRRNACQTQVADAPGSPRPAPLVARVPFPEEWPLLLVLPHAPAGLHGEAERTAFQRLHGSAPRETETDALCRLVLTGLLPSIMERDFESFSEALFDFNARAGRAFAPIQGGVYADAITAELVAFLRGQRVRGVGQSSWGPAVFALFPDAPSAERMAARIRERVGSTAADVVVTTARNEGASIQFS